MLCERRLLRAVAHRGKAAVEGAEERCERADLAAGVAELDPELPEGMHRLGGAAGRVVGSEREVAEAVLELVAADAGHLGRVLPLLQRLAADAELGAGLGDGAARVGGGLHEGREADAGCAHGGADADEARREAGDGRSSAVEGALVEVEAQAGEEVRGRSLV